MNKDNIQRALKGIGGVILNKIKAKIKEKDVVASGKFERSIKMDVFEDLISIYSDVSYGKYVEDGTKPSKKDFYHSRSKISQLQEWIKAKGIRPRPRNKKGRFIPLKDYHYKGLPYAISTSLSKNGSIKRFNYDGSKIFTTVFNEIREEASGKIKEAFMEDIRKELNIIIQENGSNT